MLGGMGMMFKSLGIDPDQITKQAEQFIGEAGVIREEIMRQGRVIDAMARAHGINPRDFDLAPTKEIDHV